MWGYVCINSGDEYLAHSAKGSTWKDHKYIKKEGGRYYYADEKGNKGGKVNTGDFTASDGPAYMLDEGDQEYMENHQNGTDTRTHDEYMADKKAAIAAAITAKGAKYAKSLIDEHARDQIAYTMDSDAAPDVVTKQARGK